MAATTEKTEERGMVLFGTTEIKYTVTRSRRRKKTIAISLDHGTGVLVSAPLRTSVEHIRQVVLKRASWIVRNATEAVLQPCQKEFVSGEILLYRGQETRLVVDAARVRRVMIEVEDGDFRITVPARLEDEARRRSIESAVVAWYRARAAEHLLRQVEHWAKLVGLSPTRVLIRDQRKRWGSCSADGTLRFNWRLILAPPPLIDYVVVHELVHLRIRNHSKAFWNEMARYMLDYKVRRSDLRDIGLKLNL